MTIKPNAPFVHENMAGNVLWLTLNRPDQRNPLSAAMIAAIKDAVDRGSKNPLVRVIVIASSGAVFSAGHDLREMSAIPEGVTLTRTEHLQQLLEHCAQMMLSIIHSPKAVIASVQGTATAAGCQLVAACDLAIASESARFCTPGVNIGNFCTTPLITIGRNIHRKHAMELALTGELFSAEDAVRMGLINRAVPAEKLDGAVEELAQKIAAKSAQGIRSGKEAFYRQMDMPLEQAFEYATKVMVEGTMSKDSDEGVRAFFEKRTPQWGNSS